MADGSAAPFQSTRDRHAIGDFRQHLTAAPQQGGTKQPRLSMYYHKNKMVIEIRTNVDSDMNTQARGIIRAELDPPAFFAFLAAFDRILSTAEIGTERIKVLRPDFQKKNNGEPVLDVTLVFGRNKDGVVFMTGLSWDKARPAIQFLFHPGKFLQLIDNAGNIKTDADSSTDIARGYLRQWQALVPQYMFNRYVAEEYDRNKQGGGQGGGGGGYNGGGGGYNNRGGGGGGGGYNNGGAQSAPRTEDMGSDQRRPSDDKPNWDDLPF